MSQYFPQPFRSFGGIVNVKFDLSNYATKTDIKNISQVDTSSFALKRNLANLKAEVDKLDINKLVPVTVNLSKLSTVVKNEVVKKTAYDNLVAKVNNIDTNGFVLKTKYNADKTELVKKIPNTSGLVKISDYNAKISELQNKIPSISGLVTTSALTLPGLGGRGGLMRMVKNAQADGQKCPGLVGLTAVENKIPSVSNLVKKQIMTQKFVNLKRHLLIISMTNILLLQNLIS